MDNNAVEVNNDIQNGKKKKLTRKQRIVVIVVVSVCAALIIASASALAVIFTRDANKPISATPPSQRIQYSYFIDRNDTDGFYLNDGFRADASLDDLARKTILANPNIILDDDLKLHVNSGASIGALAQYVYTYGENEVAVINVTVAAIDGEIGSLEALANVSNRGTYALTSDIDVSALSSGISTFSGTLYGNHHKIIGLRLAGGLFDNIANAKIIGLDFEEVAVSDTVSTGSYGILAGTARNTEIGYCTVKGSYSLTAPISTNDALYVGGIVGYASAIARKDEAFTNEKKIYQCNSYVDISLSAAGDVKLGGIAGGVVNATVRECYAYGKVKLDCSDGSKMSGVYVGGVAGVVNKEYTAIDAFRSLDEGSRIYSYADVTVGIDGDNVGITIYVGGIYGTIINHSLVNASYGGNLDVRTAKTGSKIGGIVGSAENTTDMQLRLRNVSVSGAIHVYSIHNVCAGGIAGYMKGYTDYQATGSVLPAIETDSSVNTGLHQVSEAVAASDNR